ncbi:MAG: PAS domain S-box protein [Candidatus Omnitrophica bacterium]|jgi:diguanylate cyclase (GGDEF)-like protein/PAS domain S-box-containing protein/putative nucleotidyltransferase with HDIG domain|nr:PAS domain S-box protein [Candidatus Omnitrophota bacterium]
MFENLFSKNEDWIKHDRNCFKLLDDFGVGVAVISASMEIIALNKVMKKWFPAVDVSKQPICHKAFNFPPRNSICPYCPTIKTLDDGKAHEAVTETPYGGKVINYRIVSSPVENERGEVIAAIEVVEDVTDKLCAERQMRDAESLYHATINSLNYPIHVVDDKLRIIFINDSFKAWRRSLGLKTDIVGMDVFKAFPFLPEKAREEYNTVLRSGKPLTTEEAIRLETGDVVTETQKIPILEQGKTIKIITVVLDITRPRRNEALLRDIRRQQEAILNNIPDIAWLKDRESRFIAVNEAFGRSCGMDPADIPGKTDFNLWPKELAEKYRADDKEVVASGKRKMVEERLVEKDGNNIWIETIKTPVRDDKGNITGTTGIARDITLRRSLEGKVKESEEKYRKLFEAANDAIIIADMKTGRIVDVNRQAEELTGRSRQELIGMHQTELHPPEESDDYREKFKNVVREAIETEGKRVPYIDGEVFNSKGEKIPVLINASMLEIGGRDVAQGVFRDMSEVRKIEREKKEAEALALIDPHTQLYNYRYFQRRIHSEFELAKRRSTPLSILMVDIDYFKSVNDTFGHEFGDNVLQEFAMVLQHTCRGIDVVTRFQGEDFAIILPDTDGRGAFIFSERIQKIIKKHRFGKFKVKLRISIGVASYPEDNITTVDGLVTAVEKCVRLAKDQGGNTITTSAQLRKKKAEKAPTDEESNERVGAITKKFMDLLHRNRRNTIEAVYALAHTVGAKNAYTEEHSEDMVKYSTEIGRKIGLSEEDIEDIRHGAMLHDIGKLGISEKILLKRGKLTKKEYDIIKKHPQIGADIIRPVHFLKNVVPIILHHHERYDGYGYGSKLRGEEIPVGARIVAVVDVYQALVSNRPYRKAYPKKEALKIIKEESGTHFDPAIVKVFLDILAKEKEKKTRRRAR